MVASIIKSMLAWFVGCAIGAIITSIVMKIGWHDTQGILILGYGALTSLMVAYVKNETQIKEKEMQYINSRFDNLDKNKAGKEDVLDLKADLHCLNEKLDKLTHFIMENK